MARTLMGLRADETLASFLSDENVVCGSIKVETVGDVEVGRKIDVVKDDGLRLRSPDGSVWKIQVTNLGTIV